MAVRKKYGYDGCPETSPIVRKAFVGDPATIPVEHNPEPTTARGKRRSNRTDEYLTNLERRKNNA